MTDILIALLQVGVTTLLLGLLFAAAGEALYALTVPCGDPPDAIYRWAAGFFLGLFLYLNLFRGVALLIGSARAGCFLSLLILLGLAFTQRRRMTLRLVALTLASFVGWAIFNGLRYLGPVEHLDIYTSLGSLHGGRYSNVGMYVLAEDRVPRLTQNYGQSLLVGTQLLLASPGPLASLAAWLALSQAFFAILLFRFFRAWGLSTGAAWLGVFFVLFCNVALSANYIYLIDSGSPLGYTGYTDTTVALATWLLFLEWLRGWDREGKRDSTHLLLPALLACGWSITGPQNFIIGMVGLGTLAGALGVYLLLGMLTRVDRLPEPSHPVAALAQSGHRLLGVIQAGVVLAMAFAVGSAQGGMFLPRSWATDTGLPGMMSVRAGGETGLLPELAFAFREGGMMYWWFALHSEQFPHDWFYLETQLWNAVRILFFPIAGIVGVAVLRGLPESARLDRPSRDFWLRAAFLSFFPGVLASFWFIYHGYKWELSRFLLPGILTGLIGLVLAVNEFGTHSPRWRVWFWYALLVFGTTGPLSLVAESVLRNHLLAEARAVSYVTRLQLLLTPNRIPERYPAPDPKRPLDSDGSVGAEP